MSDILFVRLGRRRNLFANLHRVVIEGSRGLVRGYKGKMRVLGLILKKLVR